MRTKNAMQRRAQEYLDERRRLGYDPSRIGNLLLSFARFADEVAKFCAQDEPKTAIPSIDKFGPAHRRLTPRIYSDEEIADLLAAAGRLPPEGTLRPATYQTLFGLIAAVGLRRSEALKLLRCDFDAAQNRLTMRRSTASLGMCICIQR
jgi:integrase